MHGVEPIDDTAKKSGSGEFSARKEKEENLAVAAAAALRTKSYFRMEVVNKEWESVMRWIVSLGGEDWKERRSGKRGLQKKAKDCTRKCVQDESTANGIHSNPNSNFSLSLSTWLFGCFYIHAIVMYYSSYFSISQSIAITLQVVACTAWFVIIRLCFNYLLDSSPHIPNSIDAEIKLNVQKSLPSPKKPPKQPNEKKSRKNSKAKNKSNSSKTSDVRSSKSKPFSHASSTKMENQVIVKTANCTTSNRFPHDEDETLSTITDVSGNALKETSDQPIMKEIKMSAIAKNASKKKAMKSIQNLKKQNFVPCQDPLYQVVHIPTQKERDESLQLLRDYQSAQIVKIIQARKLLESMQKLKEAQDAEKAAIEEDEDLFKDNAALLLSNILEDEDDLSNLTKSTFNSQPTTSLTNSVSSVGLLWGESLTGGDRTWAVNRYTGVTSNGDRTTWGQRNENRDKDCDRKCI